MKKDYYKSLTKKFIVGSVRRHMGRNMQHQRIIQLMRDRIRFFSKKSASFFMPNKNTQWCVMNKCGNPTRSTLVNELIKMMKKKEVRKQGKPSQSR